MSRQWIRDLEVVVENASGKFDLSSMRTRFEIKDTTMQSPRIAAIRISNLSDKTAQAIAPPGKAGGTVTLSAGYQEGSGRIFKGEIKQTRVGRENPTDTYVDIFAATNDRAYNHAVVNKTLKAGSTGKDVYDTAVEAMKKYDAEAGDVPEALSKLKYPKPVVLFGMARDILRTLAHSVNSTWNIRDGKVDVMPADSQGRGDTIVLNSSSGLIGRPVQTQLGITARCLINPRIGINSKIKIDQKSIERAAYDLSYAGQGVKESEPYLVPIATDGMYRVVAMDVVGDTHGQPWYDELYLVGAQAGLNPAQVGAGFGRAVDGSDAEKYVGPN